MEDGLTPTHQGEDLPLEVDRARRLFLYLRDLTELRSKPTRDLENYEQVVWFSDVPSGSAAWSAFHDGESAEGEDAWLSIERVRMPARPEPPETVGAWIQTSPLSKFELDEPGLVDPDEPERDLPAEVVTAYQSYVVQHWRPWAQRCRELKPVHDFYTQLFAMSERQQSLGEIYELVIAMGLLAWTRTSHPIRRHLITSPAEINVDPDTGVIEVRPSETEGRNRFELDMLDPVDRGPARVVEEISHEVERLDPLALGADAGRLLSRWLNQAHSQGQFETSLMAPRSGHELKLALAPALVLRKRGQRTLTELLGGIADSIRDAGELTENVFSLVSTEDRPSSSGDLQFGDPEVYFPLPANDEQRRIVDRMQRQRGVVVQGPPGTGKSHTIANLISHLLAQGKRTLVTSHTERALRVLRDKLPDDIKPLCIALLGGDRQSIQDLEAAIGSISARQSGWSPEQSEARIAELRSTLHRVRMERTEKTNLLRQIRESDTHPTTVGRYRGTSQEIAQRLSSERNRFGWIPDQLGQGAPPLTSGEFLEYLNLRWDLPDDADATASARLPDTNDLVQSVSVDQLFQREGEIARSLDSASRDFGDWVDGLSAVPEGQLRAAIAALEAHRERLSAVATAGSWASDAVSDITRGRSATWQALYTDLQKHHSELEAALISMDGARVDVPAGIPVDAARAAVREFLALAEAKGKLRTGLFASGVVREHRDLLDGLRVDGAQPLEAGPLRRAEAHLTAHIALENIRHAWGSRLEVDTTGAFTQQQASLAQERDALQRLLELEKSKEAALSALGSIAGIPAVDFADESEVRHLVRGLSVVDLHQQAIHANAQIDDAKSVIGESGHVVVALLRQAIDQRDTEAYRGALRSLESARAVAAAASRRRELTERLSNIPRLLSGLPPSKEVDWVERGKTFEDAWHWAYANAELERILDPDQPRKLSLEVGALEDQEQSTLSELSAELAWLRMFEGLSRDQSQALTAWTKAVRRIGKGTGKYAPEHRRVAREYMGKARDSIPAWIMPMYRVAESVSPIAEPFDVVIIDEASQSGVESLFLFYLAKQVIVVGDDKQIAPEAVGVNREEVMRLQRQYLRGLPFSELYEPTVSLFDQAETRFPGATIRLTEHFRCMPEIIEFSNRIAYSHEPLVPLRQFGAGRLDPIKTVHLPFGYREGDTFAINRAEAEEVVARIEKLCVDPRYDDLTFGVISLQGEAQARLIEQKLIERIGPQQMLERRIVCGDAYAFQGDERDVIFLSMVAAPNARIGPLSRDQDRRRFNVAASRARDQVTLIHSAKAEDLSNTDIRREMLEYYLHPDVQHLEELAEFDPTIVNSPFESRFEQDVYLEIRRRGYRVVPQVRFAGYRIDLVVEGWATRLAVECDGDEWHGIDRWEADSVRQRQLERAGWRFERIRGSAFYRHPNGALEPVWLACTSLGIEPGVPSTTFSATTEEPITGFESGERDAVPFVVPDHTVTGVTATSSEIGRTGLPPADSSGAESQPGRRVTGRHISARDPLEDAPSHDPSFPRAEATPIRKPDAGRRDWLTSRFDPYRAWNGSGLPDPREASRREVAAHLIEIISVEGPLTTDRVYELFIKGAGFVRVTRPARSGLNRSLHLLAGDLDIDEFENPETHWPQRVVRIRGTDPLHLRELGPRDLYQVPLNEIAAVIHAETQRRPGLRRDELKRSVLEGYGLRKLTQRADRYLDAAMKLIPDRG